MRGGRRVRRGRKGMGGEAEMEEVKKREEWSKYRAAEP